MNARIHGIVPAAGGGSRYGGTVAKQYAQLAGRPMLARTLERLLAGVRFVHLHVVVAPDDTRHRTALGELNPRVGVLPLGGATRAQTVRNALDAIVRTAGPDDWVLVHDAARPCVPIESLQRLVAAATADATGALLAVPVADTLKREHDARAAGSSARVLRTEDRRGLWQAQTPQMFKLALLREALARSGEVTDEAQAIEKLAASGRCSMPLLVPGSAQNLKVTYPADLALAAAILSVQGSGQ
jgi:2-C-methyl-D-erythritol 4-phosphate cytidylyltransferase